MNRDSPLFPLTRLINAEVSDLRSLAIILGEDPANFYISTDLSGVDVRGQDLRGMDLSRTNIENAIFDSTSRFDEDLQNYLSGKLQRRYLEVSKDLLEFTYNFFSTNKFRSRGWFIKAIVPDAAQAISEDLDSWYKVIASSMTLDGYFRSQERDRIELLLGVRDYEQGQNLGSAFGGRGPALTALIIVGLLRLIDFNPMTDSPPLSKNTWLREYKSFPKYHSRYL